MPFNPNGSGFGPNQNGGFSQPQGGFTAGYGARRRDRIGFGGGGKSFLPGEFNGGGMRMPRVDIPVASPLNAAGGGNVPMGDQIRPPLPPNGGPLPGGGGPAPVGQNGGGVNGAGPVGANGSPMPREAAPQNGANAAGGTDAIQPLPFNPQEMDQLLRSADPRLLRYIMMLRGQRNL